MRGQSFINFLREEEGKADGQKVLALSAIVGSSVLAQMMFAGTALAAPGDCQWDIGCGWQDQSNCIDWGCEPRGPCVNQVMTCY